MHKLFRETASDTEASRIARDKIRQLTQARQINAILVTELSRWGRSTPDLLITLDQVVNRHSTVTHYQRPNMTHPQEGGTGGEVSEILFFSAKSKRHPSLIYSMQIIPVCLSIVARRNGVSATRRGGLNWTPISLLVGHPCKLFHRPSGRLEGFCRCNER